MATGAIYHARAARRVHAQVGEPRDALEAGEVGFIIAGIKELQAAKVGDTVTLSKKLPDNAGHGDRAAARLQGNPAAGVRRPVPDRGQRVRRAARRAGEAQAQRRSLHYEPEVSQALGFGFRCGFLGLLHMEIVQERLEREFDQDLITTAPERGLRGRAQATATVIDGREPVQDARPRAASSEIREPIVTVHLYMPQDYVGPGDDAGQPEARRADEHGLPRPPGHADLRDAAGRDRARLLRQAEVASSRGYASMDYEFKEYRAADVVKVDILINGEKVDALSIIVHRAQSQYRGRAVVAEDARA